MSGVEVIGIVLGILPLVIQGVDNYSRAVSNTQKFLNSTREFRSLRRKLETENQIFRNSCEILLRNITSDADTSLLIGDVGGERWKNPELETQLKKQLGASYSTCCETMKHMSDVTQDLYARLGLGSVKQEGSKPDLRSFKKLKFSMSRSTYEDIMRCIREDNNAFQQLTKQSILLEPIRSRRKRKILDFQAMRDETNSIFRTIDERLQCECRPRHILCLCLESSVYRTRSSTNHSKKAVASGHRLVFAFDPEIDMRLADLEVVALKIGLQDAQAPSLRHTAPLEQLCNTIPRSENNQHILLVESTTNRQHLVVSCQAAGSIQRFSSEKAARSRVDKEIQLRGFMKRRLALTVASSVLQLYKTPWLQDQLDRSNLAFVRSADGSLLASPLILKQFFPAAIGASRTTRFGQPAALLSIRNACIYTLGVFLIELCLGKSMKDMQEPRDEIPGGMLDFLPEFLTAKRLISAVYDEAGKRYGDAVRRCIYCDFDQREYDLENNDFCQAVYEGVVTPLEEDVRLIDGPDALLGNPFGYMAV